MIQIFLIIQSTESGYPIKTNFWGKFFIQYSNVCSCVDLLGITLYFELYTFEPEYS